MIQGVYGVKEFQTQLPKITRKIGQVGGHYLVTNRNKPVFVTLPFDDYKELEDILWELNSPTLLKSIELGRKEYLQGKTKELTKVLKEINDGVPN